MKKPVGWSHRLNIRRYGMQNHLYLLPLLVVIVTIKVKVIIRKR